MKTKRHSHPALASVQSGGHPVYLANRQSAGGYRLAVAALAAMAGTSLSAAVITGLETGNLSISTTDPATAGTTEIYDRTLPHSAARTSGRIVFDGDESDSPGLKIVNDAPPGDPASNGDVFNAVMANSTAGPNSPKQSGKRLKFQRTAHEATDLVFNHNPSGTFATEGNDGLYKFYTSYANATTGRLAGFRLSVGTGVGEAFVKSGLGDGLSFKQTFNGNPPNNSQFSALFPNGLFGPIDDAHPLQGYFSGDRSGFNIAFTDEDQFESGTMFGAYQGLFGRLLSQGELPMGFFYDDDGDPETDGIIVAHQVADGRWVRNRRINGDGTVSTEAFGHGGEAYNTEEELISDLKATSGLDLCDGTFGVPCLTGSALIDDLAKFNLTFFADPNGFAGSQLTLRIESTAEPDRLITSISLTDTTVSLVWTPFGDDIHYVVEASPDLTPGSWTPIGVPITDGTTSITVPRLASPHFFRVAGP